MTAGMDDSLAASQPIARYGTPEDVAAMALFIAADATYSTGCESIVDGGATTGSVILTDTPTGEAWQWAETTRPPADLGAPVGTAALPAGVRQRAGGEPRPRRSAQQSALPERNAYRSPEKTAALADAGRGARSVRASAHAARHGSGRGLFQQCDVRASLRRASPTRRPSAGTAPDEHGQKAGERVQTGTWSSRWYLASHGPLRRLAAFISQVTVRLTSESETIPTSLP